MITFCVVSIDKWIYNHYLYALRKISILQKYDGYDIQAIQILLIA
jgi:hypothetical protein